jgi:hypothetical protein
MLVQYVANQLPTKPILVQKTRPATTQSDPLSEKCPVLPIKRFFSEPWFGFCNLAITAPYLHCTYPYQWLYPSWRRPTSACVTGLAWNRNVPKEVNGIHDYQ